MYSWIRFTWTSKNVLGFRMIEVSVRRKLEARTLFAALILAKSATNEESSANFFSFAIREKSVIHPLPIALVISLLSSGFEASNQRRWVIPLVLLLNRSGKIVLKWGNIESRSSWLWRAATPLVEWLPTIARLAIRTCFGLDSSMIEI